VPPHAAHRHADRPCGYESENRPHVTSTTALPDGTSVTTSGASSLWRSVRVRHHANGTSLRVLSPGPLVDAPLGRRRSPRTPYEPVRSRGLVPRTVAVVGGEGTVLSLPLSAAICRPVPGDRSSCRDGACDRPSERVESDCPVPSEEYPDRRLVVAVPDQVDLGPEADLAVSDVLPGAPDRDVELSTITGAG
jgi:hypothetical protein